ncbi:MAG: hypothetical protein ABEK36_03565 [Candidatus Aenigmatarchaeota archaeon]
MNGRNLESYQTEEDENPVPNFIDHLQDELTGKVEIDGPERKIGFFKNGSFSRDTCNERIYRITHTSNGLKENLGKVVVKDNISSKREIYCRCKLPSEDVRFSLGVDKTLFGRRLKYKEGINGDKPSWVGERLDNYDVPFP